MHTGWATFIIRIVVFLLLAWAFLLPGGNPARPADPLADRDVEHWSRIVVEKAFISRETYQDYRDTHSAPEFGWHVRQASRHLAGGALYTTLYVPYHLKTKLRMSLVERDVFSDDLVAAFDLKNGSHRYVITRAGDFAVLERTSFFPDKKSGDDSRPPGRRLQPGKDNADSVSFLDGDYTDYYRLPARSGGSRAESEVMGLFYSGRCRLDFPGGNTAFFPGEHFVGSVFLIDVRDARRLRVRSAVGAGRCKYVLHLVQGAAVRAGIRKRYLRHLDGNQNSMDFDHFADTMNKYDPDGTRKFCSGRAPRKAGTGRIACAFFLYRHGNAGDRNRLNRSYDSESERYRSLLKRSHRKYGR